MKKPIYDTMIVGPISLDIMIDCHDVETRLTGGAVVQSGYAAANVGAHTAIFTKTSPSVDVYDAFANCPADIYWRPSAAPTSIRNKYFTEDKERRELLHQTGEGSSDETQQAQQRTIDRVLKVQPFWPDLQVALLLALAPCQAFHAHKKEENNADADGDGRAFEVRKGEVMHGMQSLNTVEGCAQGCKAIHGSVFAGGAISRMYSRRAI